MHIGTETHVEVPGKSRQEPTEGSGGCWGCEACRYLAEDAPAFLGVCVCGLPCADHHGNSPEGDEAVDPSPP